jgi:hypothetical protein
VPLVLSPFEKCVGTSQFTLIEYMIIYYVTMTWLKLFKDTRTHHLMVEELYIYIYIRNYSI